MRGLMMDRPLLVSQLIDYGAEVHPTGNVVSRRVEGDIHRYSYAEARGRIAKLANALVAYGIKPGDRVATIAWNTYRHFELYYAVAGIGAVCHTINPRLFPEQIVYVLNHAEDRLLFMDLTFLPLAEKLGSHFKTVEAVVALADAEALPESDLASLISYEAFLEGESDRIDWPTFDENTACGLCYTSGTTGHPKGVLYSHRSSVLHAMSVAVLDGCNATPRDTIMPVVPLFHVNAWGLPYAGPLVGANLVFPGAGMDGASLFDLMQAEGVTSAWGVPTIWFGLLAEFEKRGTAPDKLEGVVVGGAAPPRSMIEAFETKYGVNFVHGWGMTETSPVATVSQLRSDMAGLSDDAAVDIKTRQGRRLFSVDMKLVDEDGNAVPHDGETRGEILVRGPYVAAGYYKDDAGTAAALTDDGWFRTGDVATIDADSYMTIVDRTKDMIKSGGEWISSIDLENAAVGHPALAEAAVIGIAHPRWGERPLLVAVLREDASVTPDELRTYLSDKVARFWLPDAVEFVDELPHGATGKLQKTKLREQFKDYVLPEGGDAA